MTHRWWFPWCLMGWFLVGVTCHVQAAVSFDAVTPWDANNVSSYSFNHTVGSGCSNAFLQVGTGWNGPSTTLTSTLYNSVALTHTVYALEPGDGLGANIRYLVNPTKGSAQSVVVTFPAVQNDSGSVASSYCGVDQSTPVGTAVGANGTTTPATVNVSSATGELVTDIVFAPGGETISVGAGQTARINTTTFQNRPYGSSDEPGAATTTMSWTLGANNYFVIVGLPLKPAAATPNRRVSPIIFGRLWSTVAYAAGGSEVHREDLCAGQSYGKGHHTCTAATVPSAAQKVRVELDRTLLLNPDAIVTFLAEISPDGETWQHLMSGTTSGGEIMNGDQVATRSSVMGNVPPGIQGTYQLRLSMEADGDITSVVTKGTVVYEE